MFFSIISPVLLAAGAFVIFVIFFRNLPAAFARDEIRRNTPPDKFSEPEEGNSFAKSTEDGESIFSFRIITDAFSYFAIFLRGIARVRYREIFAELLIRLNRSARAFFPHLSQNVRSRMQILDPILTKRFDGNTQKKTDWKKIQNAKSILKRIVPDQNDRPKLAARFEENAARRVPEDFSAEEDFWLGILRQNPRNPHPYKKLGEIYMKRGDYTEACSALAYVLRHNPGDGEAKKWLEDMKKR